MTSTPRSKTDTPPFGSFPLETTFIRDRPHVYMIDGIEIGPGYVFSRAKRMKGRPYSRAECYVLAEIITSKDAFLCEIGKDVLTPQTMEIHHRVNKWRHIAGELGPACHRHNAGNNDATSSPDSERGQGRPSERERERLERGAELHGTTDYSAQEGRDHATMRPNWDEWVLGKRKEPFPLLEELKKRKVSAMKAKDLATLAVYACQEEGDIVLHSSKTYRVFLDEDVAGKKFEMFSQKGADWVRFSDAFAKRLLKESADQLVLNQEEKA